MVRSPSPCRGPRCSEALRLDVFMVDHVLTLQPTAKQRLVSTIFCFITAARVSFCKWSTAPEFPSSSESAIYSHDITAWASHPLNLFFSHGEHQRASCSHWHQASHGAEGIPNLMPARRRTSTSHRGQSGRATDPRVFLRFFDSSIIILSRTVGAQHEYFDLSYFSPLSFLDEAFRSIASVKVFAVLSTLVVGMMV